MAIHDSSTLNYYETHAQEYCDSTANLDLSKLYDRFLTKLDPGSHILDAGCGSGRDTRAFLERGYCVTSIDASAEMARRASVFSGHNCQVLAFDEMDFEGVFDGIWACASLLHVPKAEIFKVMTLLIQALKSGGILYISLKEGEGERIADDGRFFSDYTLESFRQLIAGFPELCETDFWITEVLLSSSYRAPWLNFILSKKRYAASPL
jgi:SAM-dependent methyltransferase